MEYKIVATGSKGNAVILDSWLMIDCGVPFKALLPHYKTLKLVLLTHIHGDHFNTRSIKKLTEERPTLVFACCSWLVPELVRAGVPKLRIAVLSIGYWNDFGLVSVAPFEMAHNVPNCCFKLLFPNGYKIFYATDTGNLNGISARDYDLYMIEANYEKQELESRLKAKQEQGVFAYEMKVSNNHLAKDQCDNFFVRNAGPKSELQYLHCHEEEVP